MFLTKSTAQKTNILAPAGDIEKSIMRNEAMVDHHAEKGYCFLEHATSMKSVCARTQNGCMFLTKSTAQKTNILTPAGDIEKSILRNEDTVGHHAEKGYCFFGTRNFYEVGCARTQNGCMFLTKSTAQKTNILAPAGDIEKSIMRNEDTVGHHAEKVFFWETCDFCEVGSCKDPIGVACF